MAHTQLASYYAHGPKSGKFQCVAAMWSLQESTVDDAIVNKLVWLVQNRNPAAPCIAQEA